MAKSVIILSVSVLVIVAVLLMLKFSDTTGDPDQASRNAYSDIGDGEPYALPEVNGDNRDEEMNDLVQPDPVEPPKPRDEVVEKPEPPVPDEPKPVELPAKVALPCSDFLATRNTDWTEIVERYYGGYKVGNKRVIDDAALRKELIATLAGYNEMSDADAVIATGRTLKLAAVYIVEKGDTLDAIARKIYGTSAAVDDIYKANPKLHDRGKGFIKIGWLLLLP